MLKLKKVASLVICASAVHGTGSAHAIATQTLQVQCGACHTASLPTAQRGALDVFDLDQADWVSRIRPKHKNEMIRRLEQRRGMTPTEVSYLMPKGWKPLPKPPSLAQIQEVKNLLGVF